MNVTLLYFLPQSAALPLHSCDAALPRKKNHDMNILRNIADTIIGAKTTRRMEGMVVDLMMSPSPYPMVKSVTTLVLPSTSAGPGPNQGHNS